MGSCWRIHQEGTYLTYFIKKYLKSFVNTIDDIKVTYLLKIRILHPHTLIDFYFKTKYEHFKMCKQFTRFKWSYYYKLVLKLKYKKTYELH